MRQHTFRIVAVTMIVATSVVGAGVPAQAANSTLVVNVAAPFRPVTHAASGGLYALAENDRPADSMLYPIRMRNRRVTVRRGPPAPSRFLGQSRVYTVAPPVRSRGPEEGDESP